MEHEHLLVTKFTHPKFNTNMESFLSNGYPVLIEDVDDTLSPSIDTILGKAYYTRDNITYIKF